LFKDTDAHSKKFNPQNNKEIKTNRRILCYWPWKSLYILRDGKVKPYGFCEEHIGDINQDSLQDIWNGRQMQTYRQRVLAGDTLDWCGARCTSGIMPEDSLRLDEN